MTREIPARAVASARFVVRWSRGWRPYLLVAFVLVVATVLRAAIQPWVGDRLYFTTYFPAIGIVAATCGLVPGLATLGGATILAWFLFMPPILSFELSKLEAIQLGFFAVVASPMLVIAAMLNLLVHWLLRQQEIIVRAKDNEVRQQAVLVRELEHRMRNLFGLVQRVAIKTLQGDRDAAAARTEFVERMAALSAASSARLGNSPTVDRLLQRQFAPYGAQVDTQDCRSIALNPTHAQELALIFHELATNAAKYGALSTPAGKVTVVCRVDESDRADPMFSFEWTETGGPGVTVPARTGFGTELLKASPEYAGAVVVLEYRPTGLHYRYRKRLSKIESRD